MKKTHLLPAQQRTSLFSPCVNRIRVKECTDPQLELGKSVFEKSVNDEKPGLSREYRDFLDVVHEGMEKSPHGNWTFPLPFRADLRLSNNRNQAMNRA